MYDPYYITWGGVLVHMLLIAPLAVFAWTHRGKSPDDEE